MDDFVIEEGIRYDDSASHAKNATDPDTDGDSYWDGWIGVYGVGDSDKVVLYVRCFTVDAERRTSVLVARGNDTPETGLRDWGIQ